MSEGCKYSESKWVLCSRGLVEWRWIGKFPPWRSSRLSNFNDPVEEFSDLSAATYMGAFDERRYSWS